MANLPAAGSSLTARTACLEAELRYAVLLRRYDGKAGDSCLEQVYEAGRRRLQARSGGVGWALPDSTAARLDDLFRFIDQVPADEVDAWLEQFPDAVLALLERRRDDVAVDRPARRIGDRLDETLAEPAPAALVGSGTG
jgi:hypothetical protein